MTTTKKQEFAKTAEFNLVALGIIARVHYNEFDDDFLVKINRGSICDIEVFIDKDGMKIKTSSFEGTLENYENCLNAIKEVNKIFIERDNSLYKIW